jgi:hypothetical protein
MGWDVIEVDGLRIAYVADIKRSEWTVLDGPDSLQFHAYGFAWAGKLGADAYCCGQWAAVEGLWLWGDVVELDSMRSLEIADRVAAAAEHTGTEYSMGAHCMGCYGRLRCPAYVLPPSQAAGELAAFTEIGPELAPEKAAELLLVCKRASDTAKAVEAEIKERVRRGLVVTDGNGKTFRPISMPGRKSVDQDALSKVVDLSKYEKKGEPYYMFRWGK